MIAEAWEREANPDNLLKLLQQDFSRRKLRHFVCNCVRDLLPNSVRKEDLAVLAFAERIADEETSVDPDEWSLLHQRLGGRASGLDICAATLDIAIGQDIYDDAHWALECLKQLKVDSAVPLAFMREIFGNPFRPIDFAPWRTDTAVALARQMYESREFGAMPILADALQDARCDNTDVLNHCRDATQTHVRGCWVVDGVLGKE